MPKPLYVSGPARAVTYGTPRAERNVRTTGAVSVVSMPRNATSFACSFLYAATRSGVSARHGGHHVAQKLRTTTLPTNDCADTAFPSSVWTVNAGACEPSGAPAGSGAAAPEGARQRSATPEASENERSLESIRSCFLCESGL